MNVYVVTGLDLGWDNVVGVYSTLTITREDLEKEFPEQQDYAIFEVAIQTDL